MPNQSVIYDRLPAAMLSCYGNLFFKVKPVLNCSFSKLQSSGNEGWNIRFLNQCLGNVTKKLSARHFVSLFSADLELLLQLLTGGLAFPPQNKDFCIIRIICENNVVVEVVLGVFTMYHVMGKDTGGFLCICSGNISGIKMAMAKSGLLGHFAVESDSCLGIFSVYGNAHTWVFSAEGNLFLILTREESGIFQIVCLLGWSQATCASLQLKATWHIYLKLKVLDERLSFTHFPSLFGSNTAFYASKVFSSCSCWLFLKKKWCGLVSLSVLCSEPSLAGQGRQV